VAEPAGQGGLFRLGNKSGPVVDEDEVVAPAVHFKKRNVLPVFHAYGPVI
jgi:hypothetical protein